VRMRDRMGGDEIFALFMWLGPYEGRDGGFIFWTKRCILVLRECCCEFGISNYAVGSI
jgi:hypothetical protein